MKDRLVQATLEEMKSRSLKFTMDDLARKLHVSKSSIYKMVESKEDLVRLVISASDLGLSGYQLADRLYEKYRIGMELADDRYVVAVVTYANEESDMRQLVEALEDISRKMTGNTSGDAANVETRLIPPIPPMIDTPRQAFFKEKKRIPWREAKGRIAAEALIPYPPGIPLVNPGELVTEEIWEYMEEYRKKGLHFHGPSDASLDSFCVL